MKAKKDNTDENKTKPKEEVTSTQTPTPQDKPPTDSVTLSPVDGDSTMPKGDSEDATKASTMPTSVQRKLSIVQSERKRSIAAEDAEWVEAEQEQLKIIDPAKAATLEAEKAGTVTNGAAAQEPKSGGLSENAERKLSVVSAERRRSMGTEDAEWVEAEVEQHAILENTAGPASTTLSELGSPEYEEEGYHADLLVPDNAAPAAPSEAPSQIDGDGSMPGTTERRKSMQEAERRRSMAEEDAEWMEAEAEQREILQSATPAA